MKKYIAWALAALMIVPVSCNKGNVPQMEEPATKALAQVITFNKESAVIGSYTIDKIELTEAGRYIVWKTQTRAAGDSYVDFGNFTYSNGVFNLSGFGNVTINGNHVTLTFEVAGGSPTTVNATITPTTTSDPQHDNLCRTWKVGKTIFGISGGPFGLAGVEKVFNNGINMPEILDWVVEYITISDENKATLLKYTVQEVSLTGAGAIAVKFSQADPFVGTYKLNNTNISFGFDADDIPFISSGQFAGSVSFSGNTCLVVANATMVYNNETYAASLEMTLTEAK